MANLLDQEIDENTSFKINSFVIYESSDKYFPVSQGKFQVINLDKEEVKAKDVII